MERYARQLLCDGIGIDGQQKLRNARVLIVGMGGLGAPIALYLAGAGVGTLGLLDDDCVSLSNLHRQILYGEGDLGMSKAICAGRRLASLNSKISLNVHPIRLTEENGEKLISEYDVVVDGCDNFETRLIVDRLCRTWKKPYVFGAVEGWEGQVSVFHLVEDRLSYRDLFFSEKKKRERECISGSLSEGGKGIVGPVPGVVGSVMASQVLLILTSGMSPLSGRLWTMDLRSMESLLLEL